MSKDLKEGAMCKMRGKQCIRGNSMCKGPGVVAKLVDWKKSKGAGVERVRRGVVAEEVIEVGGTSS